jgi:hypothetical protein
MNNDKTPEWTGKDIANLARDVGKPLPLGMKERIMARIDEEARGKRRGQPSKRK